MKIPKSSWPEYFALVLFVSGPIMMAIAGLIALFKP